MQLGTTLRNNMIGQYESTVGAAPVLELRSGAAPANCAAADSGTLLSSITLPSDWMTAASNGSIAKLGTWAGTGDAGAGGGSVIGHYRLKDAGLTECHEQGTVTITGGGGDLTVDNTNIAVGQAVSITGWTRNQGGA